jgi:uncharacterized membrane protein (Fun14 family)
MGSDLIPVQTLKKMLTAMKGVIEKHWPEVKDYAEQEARKIAERTDLIVEKFQAGALTEDVAKRLMQMQLNATKGTLEILKGMSKLLAEKAVNAAIEVLRKAIEGVLPFDIFARVAK